MKRSKRHYINLNINLILICLLSLIGLGVLFYSPLSHEAVPNDSDLDHYNYLPPIDPATNVHCKKVVINPASPDRVIKFGVKGGETPECDNGFVAVGIINGRLNTGNATTATWLFDSNPDSWGLTVSYVQSTTTYNAGLDSLNAVSLVCVPRQIVFTEGPCP